MMRAWAVLSVVGALGAASGGVAGCDEQAVDDFEKSLDEWLDELDEADENAEEVGWDKTPQEDLDQIPDEVIEQGGEVPAGIDLSDRVPPPGDQGAQGSCAAWAGGYGLASALANESHGWGLAVPEHFASPRSLYAQVLANGGTSDCDTGATGQEVLEPLVQVGVASLRAAPYTDQSCVMSQTANTDDFRIASYADINPPDNVEAVKAVLAQGKVVMWGAIIYDDFQEFGGSQVYAGSGNFLTQGELHAGHMMLVVGYDDDRQAFRVMNSWGDNWGDAGFVWLAYPAYVDMSKQENDGTWRGEAWVGTPLGSDGSALTLGPAGQGGMRARQVVDVTGRVVLAFDYDFGQPVRLRGVRAVDPAGREASQPLKLTATAGQVHFARADGFAWVPGTYTVRLDATALDGTAFPFEVKVVVPALGRGPAGLAVGGVRGFEGAVLGSSRLPAILGGMQP